MPSPDEVYREGTTIAEIEADARGATVVLQDGGRHRFDVVVGADGYRSRVRSLVFPGSQPTYAGYVLWRGNYEERRLPPGLPSDADSGIFTVGFPGGHAIFYLIPDFGRPCHPGQRRMNWAVYTGVPDGIRFDDPSSVAPGWVSEDLVAFFENVLEEHFPPYWAEVVRRTGVHEISMQPIYDEAMPTYVPQRLLLIGDASTVTRPHTASGATKALQDALALERACREHATWSEVLAAYDAERCAVGNDLVELGRRIGRAQVEETPEWDSLTVAEFEAWVQATISGHRLYLYEHTDTRAASPVDAVSTP